MPGVRVRSASSLVAAVVLVLGCASGAGPSQTQPPGALYLSADNVAFVQHTVQAPADSPFQLYFENLENVPHNVNVAAATGTSVAKTEVFSGPAGHVLEVPALAAGTYKLLCEVHPEMFSQLFVR